MAKKHTIKQGECISSVAFENGFYPDTLWDLPTNGGLRELRKNGNVLLPGDVVDIPDLREGNASCVTAKRHVFRRRGVPEKLNLELRADGDTREVGYTITIDGVVHEGRTVDGRIMQWIPPGAKRATLQIGGAERFDLALGHLAPVSTREGQRARLVSLGYLSSEDAERGPDEDHPAIVAAVREFQRTHELAPTGVADDALESALVEAHGA